MARLTWRFVGLYLAGVLALIVVVALAAQVVPPGAVALVAPLVVVGARLGRRR